LKTWVPAALLLALSMSWADAAAAPNEPVIPTSTATFALIIGVNRADDAALKPLLYADDDAARYQLLFQSLGAHTALLTRPDENTRRVLPAAIALAQTPNRASLAAAVTQLGADVRAARARGQHTVFYFLFAGHGNVDQGRAYLALEDQRLDGEELDRLVLRPIGADQTHLIVDACYSYFLARERGPGGQARVVRGFSATGGGLDRPDVGLLLSTSSARESHEWDGFQAGVFSHEVRSGLAGAADANGDGRVDYREIAAFIVRANEAIPNDRLRPDVFARPPQGEPNLFDLHPGGRRNLVVDGRIAAGHYFIEDRAGNRLLDFHSAPGQTVKVIRSEDETVFLRNVDNDREYEIARGTDEIQVSSLTSKAAVLRTRGAAHHAFSLIFSLPFDAAAVAAYHFPPAVEAPENTPPTVTATATAPVPVRVTSWKRRAAIAAAVGAGLGAAGALAIVVSSRGLAAEADQATSQRETVELNERIERDRRYAAAIGAAATVAAGTALTLWLWPAAPATPAIALTPGGPSLYGLRARF
jgi:hypothetical protein